MLASAILHVNKKVDREGWLLFEYHLEGPIWRKLGPIQPFYRKNIPETTYTSLIQRVNQVLRASVPDTRPATFETLGRLLYNNLVPEELRPRLLAYKGAIDLWTNTVAVPWELILDGEEFWGKRYALGRTIRMPSDQTPSPKPAVSQQRLTVLLITADPLGDLSYAEKEVKGISETLPGTVSTKMLVGPQATDIELMSELNRGIYDIIHYSGHVVVDPHTKQSALLLNNGILPSSSIRDNLHGAPFVFINGCRPDLTEGQPSPWETGDWDEMNRNISDGFIFGGAIGVIATLNRVGDRQAKQFAESFYELILQGRSFGEAVQSARSAVTEGVGWASFVLFGDPNLSIQQRVSKEEVASEPEIEPPPTHEASLFTSTGVLNPAVFAQQSCDVLAKAAKDMQSLDDHKIEPYHLLMGLTRSVYFFALFSHVTGSKGAESGLSLKLLRSLVRRTYHKKEVGKGQEWVPLWTDIHEQTAALLHTAQDLAQGHLIEEKHLLIALLRNIPAELRQAIEQSHVTVSDLLINAERFSFFPTQWRMPSEAEIFQFFDTLQKTARGGRPPEPHPLFTADGLLREEKLALGTREILERGCGYGAAINGSDGLLTPGLFLALLDNEDGVTTAAIRAQKVEPETIRQKLRGNRPTGKPRPVRQQVCSQRVLIILRRASEQADTEGKVIGEVHLLHGVLNEPDGPTFASLNACGIDPKRMQTACQLN